MHALSIVLVSLGAAFLSEQTVPIANPEAAVFLAQARGEATPGVFVSDGWSLTLYERSETRRLELDEGTSAFDIADIDGDGDGEVISICGDRITTRELFARGAAAEIRELFRAESEYAARAAKPCRRVLVVRREDRIMLGLPRVETFEWRALDGSVVEVVAPSRDVAAGGGDGTVLWVSAVAPERESGLHMRVRRRIDTWAWAVSLGQGEALAERGVQDSRRAAARRSWETSEGASDSWPWFPLTRDGDPRSRVLYAAGESGGTVLQVREASVDGKGVATRGKRRCPGTLVTAFDEPPDFNGDGFADVALWHAPDPGRSVDALTRALSQGTWPLRIAIHLYLPGEKHHSPQPAARIECRVPTGWFLDMPEDVPARNVLLRDLNGDGRTDIALSQEAAQFSTWLWRENGFATAPDDARVYDEPIERIEFCEDLDGRGQLSIGLRTAHSLRVLRPAAAETGGG